MGEAALFLSILFFRCSNIYLHDIPWSIPLRISTAGELLWGETEKSGIKKSVVTSRSPGDGAKILTLFWWAPFLIDAEVLVISFFLATIWFRCLWILVLFMYENVSYRVAKNLFRPIYIVLHFAISMYNEVHFCSPSCLSSNRSLAPNTFRRCQS